MEWRDRIGKKRIKGELPWRILRHSEFVNFMDRVAILANIYNWSLWGGEVNNFAVTLTQDKPNGKNISIAIMGPKYGYYVSYYDNWNPNNIAKSTYEERISDDMEGALNFLEDYLRENKYEAAPNYERICVMGRAYDRYELAKKWALEEIASEDYEELQEIV